ncbi:Uncharacterized protein PBTT_05409 [Plasmodiophora brassicae]
MGCNWSKNQDILQDRQRRSAAVAGGAGAGGQPLHAGPERSPAISVAVGSVPQPTDEVTKFYGTSHTDRHMQEANMLRGIIEQTHQDFIDVTQEPAFMDEAEADERRKKYVAEFGNGAFGQLLKPIPEMFDHAFQSAEDLVAALVRPVPPEDERAWVLATCESVCRASRVAPMTSDGRALIVTFDSV